MSSRRTERQLVPLDEALEAATAALQDLFAAAARPESSKTEPWRLLSLAQAAERLGRSERWVRERVRRRELAVVRLDGGALGFLVDDLIAFAYTHRIEGHS